MGNFCKWITAQSTRLLLMATCTGKQIPVLANALPVTPKTVLSKVYRGRELGKPYIPGLHGVKGGHVASLASDSESSLAGSTRVLCSSYLDRKALCPSGKVKCCC